MKITLQKSIELLQQSAGIVTDRGITFPSIIYDENDDNFLFFKFEDDDGFIFEYDFYSKDNQEVELVGSSLFLIDSEEETIQITLLKNWEAEREILMQNLPAQNQESAPEWFEAE